MEITKSDLSYDEVKLDYEALLRTSWVAVGGCVDRIRDHLNTITAIPRKSMTSISLHGYWLKQAAERLAVACETVAALEEGKTRNNKILVNIPDVKEELKKAECEKD